jgi:glycosyltransferase involved in cell wall biosynthesis
MIVLMTRTFRALSVYEAFFSGGARALHNSVLIGLHARHGLSQSVLSIHREVVREATVQPMERDAGYRSLVAAGIPVSSLGRPAGRRDTGHFSAEELSIAARQANDADVVLLLKEQPVSLINQVEFPDRPVIVCLHRSDPQNQGRALAGLLTAIDRGRVVACVCCGDSTTAAYRAAGVPSDLLHTVRNGVDLDRFRPAPLGQRSHLRRSLGLAPGAKVIAFAARYHAMKNVPLFLRAARSFLMRERTGQVVMCGAGMSTANPELAWDIDAAFAEEPRLSERLHLLGIRHDIESVYACADVVALTSSYGEAAPLCLIEGQACGAVPVTTDVGDSADIVGRYGIVTPPDPEAISHAWTEAVARRTQLQPALYRQRRRFDQSRVIREYAALMARVSRRGELPVAAARAG